MPTATRKRVNRMPTAEAVNARLLAGVPEAALRRRVADGSADAVDELVRRQLEAPGRPLWAMPKLVRLRLADRYLGSVVRAYVGRHTLEAVDGRLVAVARDNMTGAGAIVLRFRDEDNRRDAAISLATVRALDYLVVEDPRELDGYSA